MATGVGLLDFGSGAGSSYTTVDVVTGVSGLTAASFLEAFIMAEETVGDNSVDAHIMAPIRLRCEYLTATSFRIHALSEWTLRGTFNVRWVTV